jgi:hypothetical protein
MSPAHTGTLERSTTSTPDTPLQSLSLYRAALWTSLASMLLAGWGIVWDIQWHALIGRHSFWIGPHLMINLGAVMVVLAGFGVVAYDTFRYRASGQRAPGTVRVMGLTSTPGFHLVAYGMMLAILSVPIDEVYHKIYGLDVSMWGPAHLPGWIGSAIASLAFILIAYEVYPAHSWGRYAAVVVAAATIYANIATTLRPGLLLAYQHGGVLFYAYPILCALFLPLALVTAARISGWRWAPLLVLAIVVVHYAIGAYIARVGFEIAQPVSYLEEELAKDANASIAVFGEMARKNRTVPGSPPGGNLGQLLSFVPVGLLVALDPRRRVVAAAVAYGVGLVVWFGIGVSRSPAFQPMMPGWGLTAVALLITVGTAIVGVAVARRLSDFIVGFGRRT